MARRFAEKGVWPPIAVVLPCTSSAFLWQSKEMNKFIFTVCERSSINVYLTGKNDKAEGWFRRIEAQVSKVQGHSEQKMEKGKR